MNRVVYVFISALSIAVFFSSCNDKNASNSSSRGPSGPVLADGYLVRPQTVSETVDVPGSLIPTEQTEVKPEVSGRVVRLNIQEGGVVNEGTLLVKLFDGDLQTQLKKLEIQLEIARKTAERQNELLKINGISQQEYDLTELNVENLKIDIQAVKISIAKTEIRAPYKGKLGLRYVSLGSYLSPSDIITNIRRVNELKLEFAVPEKYAHSIEKGYKVRFKVDGGEDYHDATVMATENSVDPTTRTLMVHALVKENHPELVPGIFARVNLQLGKDENALVVPTQAIIPQARGKQVLIFRGDSVEFKSVETGIRDSAYVQVTSGLKSGDTVIISGLMAIRPNSKVKVTKVYEYGK